MDSMRNLYKAFFMWLLNRVVTVLYQRVVYFWEYVLENCSLILAVPTAVQWFEVEFFNINKVSIENRFNQCP